MQALLRVTGFQAAQSARLAVFYGGSEIGGLQLSLQSRPRESTAQFRAYVAHFPTAQQNSEVQPFAMEAGQSLYVLLRQQDENGEQHRQKAGSDMMYVAM